MLSWPPVVHKDSECWDMYVEPHFFLSVLFQSHSPLLYTTCFAQIFKDERLFQLDSIPQFETHSTILSKMYKNQVLDKEELIKFEASLQPHQRAVMGDGLTIMERGVVEHNMIAVSKIYQSIYVSDLALVLGVHEDKAEKIAASMIMEGSLPGSIDQVEGLVEFESEDNAQVTWDKAISNFCVELNRVTDALQSQ